MQLAHVPDVFFAILGLFLFTLGIGGFVLLILFICGIYKTYSCIHKPEHIYPPGVVWFLLVPVVSTVFMWILLPFAIPEVLRKALVDQGDVALRRCKKLKSAGLWLCILPLVICILPFVFAPFFPVVLGSGVEVGAHIVEAGFVVFLYLVGLIALSVLCAVFFGIYWRRMVRLREDLLAAGEREKESGRG